MITYGKDEQGRWTILAGKTPIEHLPSEEHCKLWIERLRNEKRLICEMSRLEK